MRRERVDQFPSGRASQAVEGSQAINTHSGVRTEQLNLTAPAQGLGKAEMLKRTRIRLSVASLVVLSCVHYVWRH
jgi:hypothetical protein